MGDMAGKISEAQPIKKLCDVEGMVDDDCISLLSEEILVVILSKLKLKEATSMSILARKWTSLWTFTAGSLDFEDEKTMAKLRSHPEFSSVTLERTKFITWVNKVLNLHRGPSIQELKICFDFDQSSSSEIDSWIIFAVKKSVKRIELDLLKCNNTYHAQPYKFPTMENNANVIRSLRLKHVDVTDEILDNILGHCSLLESLCVENAPHLKNAMISSPNLKILEICYCIDLVYMEVSAVNLVSVKYFGSKMHINFKNAPLLSELHTGGVYTECLMFEIPYIMNNLFQLETLKLCFPIPIAKKRYPFDPYFKLNNIKHLEVILLPSQESSLLRYTCLLVGFPSLTTFKMQLGAREPWKIFQPSFEIAFLEQIACGFAKKPHPSLKIVELVNFAAYPAEFVLARHLIQITPLLKKITVQLKDGIENLKDVVDRVGSLRSLLPPEAEFVILPVIHEDDQLI